MNFTISYKNITRCLQKAQSIIERKEIKPILSTVQIIAEDGFIHILATNLEVGLRQRCPADITVEGSTVIDARKAFEIVREMPEGMITFLQKENNVIEISSGSVVFELVGMESKEFPELNFFDDEHFQEVNDYILDEMLRRTLYAASLDERKINLNGVFFFKTTKEEKEILRLVATDGHQLSTIDKSIKDINEKGYLNPDQLDKGVIFPRKGLLELRKLLDEEQEGQSLSYLCKKNWGLFRKGDSVLVIRLIDKEFPNYSQAIPTETKKEIIIDSETILKSLKRISVVAEEKSKAVNLTFTEGVLEIYASNPIIGQGKETLPIEYTGEAIKLGFNAGYIIDTVNAIKSEKIRMRIKDEDSPVILMPADNDDHLCIIMPMEIQE